MYSTRSYRAQNLLSKTNYSEKSTSGFIKTIEPNRRYHGIREMRNKLIEKILERLRETTMRVSINDPVNRHMVIASLYEEYESTYFNANGVVKTEDGRRIDFNIELELSRSYVEYTGVEINDVQRVLMDPLVINVESNITSLSDQKFKFDIDIDGTKEEISMPGMGMGFISLDKNEDGIINDGGELFGARTGDGFKELSEYDQDGNGWIDEADDVFRKLKIWFKNEEGKDELVDLKSADIGAIFLGASNTEFSYVGASGLNGIARKTGFYLKESGGAGLIQHIDLATKK